MMYVGIIGMVIASLSISNVSANVSKGSILFYRLEYIFAPQEGEYRCYELRDALNDVEKQAKQMIATFNKNEMDLQRRAGEVNPNDVAKVGELLKERESLKIDQQMFQRHIEMQKNEVMRDFQKKVQQEIDRMRDERAVDSILQLNSGDSCRSELDITDDLIERLNDEYRREQRSKKVKSAAPALKPQASGQKA